MHEHHHHEATSGGLFETFVPRQVCMNHELDVILTHVLADAGIFLAYFAIPVALYLVARKRKDIGLSPIIVLFAAFILLCGTTHLFDIVAIWRPYYRLHGIVKMITALVSLGTAYQVWKLIPRALAVPTKQQIKAKEAWEIEREFLLENERKARGEAEDAAQRYQELYQQARVAAREREAIFEQLLEGVVITDAEGTIRFMNEAAHQLHGTKQLGVEVEDYTQSFGLFTIQGDPHPVESLPLTRAVRNGEVVENAKWLIRRSDGSEIVAEGNAKPIALDDGTHLGAVLTIRDATQIYRAEKQRSELIAALERSNEQLDRFAYMTSHDLKAPLRGIGNIASWIEEDLGASLTPDVKTNLGLLRARALRLTNMIDGILAFARAGRKSLPPQEVNVDQLVRETVSLIEVPEGVEVRIEPNLPNVMLEPVVIERIFLNLLTNAIKYGQRTPLHIEVAGSIRDGEIVYSVKDDGIGISIEHQAKVWTLFERLNSRDEIEGAGIGLAFVKKMVEERGGRVWLESESNRGATFFVAFPQK